MLVNRTFVDQRETTSLCLLALYITFSTIAYQKQNTQRYILQIIITFSSGLLVKRSDISGRCKERAAVLGATAAAAMVDGARRLMEVQRAHRLLASPPLAL